MEDLGTFAMSDWGLYCLTVAVYCESFIPPLLISIEPIFPPISLPSARSVKRARPKQEASSFG